VSRHQRRHPVQHPRRFRVWPSWSTKRGPARPRPNSPPHHSKRSKAAPSELVDKAYATKTATELVAAPITALKGISPAKAAALTQALGVHSIADLASNRYVTAAQTINTAAGSS